MSKPSPHPQHIQCRGKAGMFFNSKQHGEGSHILVAVGAEGRGYRLSWSSGAVHQIYPLTTASFPTRAPTPSPRPPIPSLNLPSPGPSLQGLASLFTQPARIASLSPSSSLPLLTPHLAGPWVLQCLLSAILCIRPFIPPALALVTQAG